MQDHTSFVFAVMGGGSEGEGVCRRERERGVQIERWIGNGVYEIRRRVEAQGRRFSPLLVQSTSGTKNGESRELSAVAAGPADRRRCVGKR